LAVKPGHLVSAVFMERPNRFLVRCRINGNVEEAFLPNPGRLREILLPDTELFVSADDRNQKRKTRYTVIAARRKGKPVLLHTHMSNSVVENLILNRRITGLEDWTVGKREATFGHSRFDFLLKNGGRHLLLEVKSCTLFGDRMAMFPDAPSLRGKKHVEELYRLSGQGYDAAVLFLVQSSHPDYFLPDFHTDPLFAEALYSSRDRLAVFPVTAEWNESLELSSGNKILQVPWRCYENRRSGEGCCIIMGNATDDRTWVTVGRSLNMNGSLKKVAMEIKGRFPFIPGTKPEYIPIRADRPLEDEITKNIGLMAEEEVSVEGRRFFLFKKSPWHMERFVEMIVYFRSDRILEE